MGTYKGGRAKGLRNLPDQKLLEASGLVMFFFLVKLNIDERT